ncbi:hypothetical protein [Mesorhizobium sp. M0998]|uniref:hypothetical protein n=1 Tax=Mesorhizobium sp. M0998 TaxID=2957044 RepID=UPI00333CF20B
MTKAFLAAVFLCLIAVGSADAAARQIAPVADLFDTVAELNGDKAMEGASAAVPILCFDTNEDSLPNPTKGKNPQGRKQLAARRALIETAVGELARRIVDANRESGTSGGAISIRIIGHADSRTPEGMPDYNAALSYRRALTIAKLLRAKISNAGGGRIGLDLQVEGRSTFDPWPNRPDDCASSTAETMELAAVSLPPIPADRRVEIRILNGALTAAGTPGDRRLRLYPAGVMPWRAVSVPLNKLGPVIPACFDGTTEPAHTAWTALPPLNLIDFDDGLMAVRLRLEPVYAPLLTGARVYIDLAGETSGTGVPGFWSVHERLGKFLQGMPEGDTNLGRLAKCLYGLDANASYFAIHAPEITKLALALLPKDVDGLMAATQGLHRNLRYVDLRPGMKFVMKGSFANPNNNRLQLGDADTFRLIPDPIDPCSADPRPRAADGDGPMADRASFQSGISDPFLAWMTRSILWGICHSNAVGPAEAGKAELAPENAAADAGLSPTVFVVGSFSQLEKLFSRGPIRMFLPLHDNTTPIKGPASPADIKDRGGLIVSAADGETMEKLTRQAATHEDDPFDPDAFDINGACQSGDKTSPWLCGQTLSQETLTPFVSFEIGGKLTELPMGTRVVHVVPAELYDTCFKDNAAAEWPEGARLARPLIWTAPGLPRFALVDRHDCRLLGLPMVGRGSVSW